MYAKDRFGIILLIFLASCNGISNSERSVLTEKDYLNKTTQTLGSKENYLKLYDQMSDTISSWYSNNLLPDTSKDESTEFKLLISKYKVDSLYVINSAKDKILGTILHTGISEAKIWSDEILEFFGAKINGKWYFWTAGATPIVRESFKGHDPRKPLSYVQMHEGSLGSVGGYLKPNGAINDAWFEAKFRGGYTRFEDRYEYKSTLDGHRIDNEKDYWNYLWKKKGQMLWIRKAYQDSVAKIQRKNVP